MDELTFKDRAKEERRLDTVYDEFTFGRRFTEENTEDFLREILALNTNLGGVTWDDLKEKGFERYTDLGMGVASIGNATDIEPDQTITAHTWHTRDKMPWPTLTRRLQFYIDHDLLPGAGGGAAGPQGQPPDRRELPAAADRRPHALVDPLDLAGREEPLAAAAR